MTTTTVDSPELAKGVPFSERTRLVAEAHPALIEALEKASQEYYRHEDTWQAEAERQQRAGGMPRRDLESPFGRALREAAAAVVEKSRELLVARGGVIPSDLAKRTSTPNVCAHRMEVFL